MNFFSPTIYYIYEILFLISVLKTLYTANLAVRPHDIVYMLNNYFSVKLNSPDKITKSAKLALKVSQLQKQKHKYKNDGQWKILHTVLNR